jgi:hypothetical protein
MGILFLLIADYLPEDTRQMLLQYGEKVWKLFLEASLERIKTLLRREGVQGESKSIFQRVIEDMESTIRATTSGRYIEGYTAAMQGFVVTAALGNLMKPDEISFSLQEGRRFREERTQNPSMPDSFLCGVRNATFECGYAMALTEHGVSKKETDATADQALVPLCAG